MINSVRNTVMAAADKNNFGYITPDDFNLYAKQAQLDVFEDYFYQYNTWIIKQNLRQSGSGFADIVRNVENVIEKLSVTTDLIYNVDSFILPDECYFLNNIRYGNKEVDKVTQDKLVYLLSSNLTAPSRMFPVYSTQDHVINVYPDSIINGIIGQYIRYPKDPKWTYVNFAGGEPLFDQSASDYQDFELPLTDEPLLVSKILQFAGVSIRDSEVVALGVSEENKNQQAQG